MTRFEKVVLWVGVIGSACSITGFSVMTLTQYMLSPESPPFSTVPKGPLWAVVGGVVGIASAIILTWSVRHELRRAHGFVIPTNEKRSRFSQAFAAPTLRRLDVFAGDLSWLEEDLPTYIQLRKRNVLIRMLTDSPGASAIALAKTQGIEFRAYANGMVAPIKASLADVDEESESRALVIKRRAPRGAASTYSYWVKVYRGSEEFAPIRAMSVLFEELYARGTPL